MQLAIGQVGGLLLKATGLHQWFMGKPLVQHRQRDQQQCPHARHDPKPDVEEKHHRQVDGKPGGIEERE
ncbi:hypothetical protein D3C72_2312930 [compost metagenome]